VRAAAPREPHGHALALEPAHGHAIEPDPVLLDRPVTGRGHRLPSALEQEPVLVGTHRGRLTRIDDAVLLAHVRQRHLHPVHDLVQVECLGDRHREHAAGGEVPAGAA